MRKRAEPVTLVRSPTLTKGMSFVSVNGSRPESRMRGRDRRKGARLLVLHRLGDGADMLGRRAAAAADDVDETRGREFAEHAGRRLRALVVEAELVRQAGVGIGADQACRRRARSPGYGRASPRAPSAQLRPMANGLACASECQKAVGVWPDSVRPERSVIVPEMMTGKPEPSSSNTSSIAKSAALAFSVSKIVSTSRRSAPPSTRPRACSP